MNPVSPVVKGFKTYEKKIAENQPQYVTIPAIPVEIPHDGTTVRGLLMRFELTEEEKQQVAETGSIWVQQLTFGRPMQPLLILTEEPNLEKK